MGSFKPYTAKRANVKEFSLRAIFLGILLGLIFGIGNAYLGLKIGTTVSASIPAAVLSMGILRLFFKRVTILENNMVQTIASVGEGLAGGVIFTVPALFLMNESPSIFHIFLLSALGGILGILFMIPMRRYIIVEEHGKLPFPEGTACAEILKSGEKGRGQAIFALLGLCLGAVYKLLSSGARLWNEVPKWSFPKVFRSEFSMDCTPALLGVGFIIGPRIASLLFFGGALGWWVLIPLIAKVGAAGTIVLPGTVPIEQMDAEGIWASYIRYIGAGAVGIGGLLNLYKVMPLLGKAFKAGIGELFWGISHRRGLSRTEQDISLRWLIVGSLLIILFLWLFPGLPMNFFTIILLVILGLFFVAVTSLTVGIVGSTSNPISGMTMTTLLITCVIFLSLGWTERIYLIAALTMSVVTNVAIALAGTTSQDLKTGFLLGATPRLQQIGEIIGIFLPALSIGATLYLLNAAYTFGSSAMPAPQGTLMALIAEAVISGHIPLTLVLIGVVLGSLVALLQLPVLPFAIGLYLPLSISTGVMVGGLVAHFVRRYAKEGAIERGVLASSGLVAGDACMGVVMALLTVLGTFSSNGSFVFPDFVSFFIYLAVAITLGLFSSKPSAFFITPK